MAQAAATLNTPRLRLRPFTERDWPAYALQRDRVISLIRPGNMRSIAVAEAIGERLHGRIDMLGSEALIYEVLRTPRT